MDKDKWDLDDDFLQFLPDEEETDIDIKDNYTILITDDEEEVHSITKILLKNFVFEGKGLIFIDAYSASETIKILKERDDIALIFLDVVMEESDSGLKVVKYIREELLNTTIRIILRTGQPGEAPEEEIIRKYDINDYRIKTELTAKRMLTSLYTAMRSYRDILRLKKYQEGLEKIIKSSSHMFKNNSLDSFLICILDELSSFTSEKNDAIYMRSQTTSRSNGFISIKNNEDSKIIAATGIYEKYIGYEITNIPELNEIATYLKNSNEQKADEKVIKIKDGFLICNYSNASNNNYVYIQGDVNSLDFDMINIFLDNFSIALDNYLLNTQLKTTQQGFVYAIADTAETHFEETGGHIKRISTMMYNFALKNNFSYGEAELIKLASTMHDIGKVSIPNTILRKPESLTLDEYNIMKQHTENGYRILNESELEELKVAAEIALYHHERYDGKGYPKGLSGKNIPLRARMMAIIDVYDAVSHNRCYKKGLSADETLLIIKENSGSYFDPALVDIFITNLEEILQGLPQ